MEYVWFMYLMVAAIVLVLFTYQDLNDPEFSFWQEKLAGLVLAMVWPITLVIVYLEYRKMVNHK